MVSSLLSLSLLFPALAAATTRPRSVITQGDGYLKTTLNPIRGAPVLGKRASVEAAILGRQNGLHYVIDIGVGTPPQVQTLIVDTGSPDMWVNPRCETYSKPAECLAHPQFDYTKSSTLQVLGASSSLAYGSGNVSVDFVTDVLTIGSATIKDQIFGVAFDSFNIPLGILGLSPNMNPAAPKYPFVIDTLVSQGIIQSRTFSLDLRSITSPFGAIIFGGIDRTKFSGSLTRIPLLPPSQSPGGTDRYWITLTGLGLTLPDGTSSRTPSLEVPVFPDSGSTISHLPTPLFLALGMRFPTALFDRASGLWVVDCRMASQSGSVDFYFAGKRIAVPYADFIWKRGDGPGGCVLGVTANDEEPILGASFLRAAYVVHDLDNRALHIAQAASCGTKENVVVMGKGAAAVPSGVVGDCSERNGPTATVGIDTKETGEPTKVYTGPGVENTGGFGPGPAGGRTETSAGVLKPTGKSGGARLSGGRWVWMGVILVGLVVG